MGGGAPRSSCLGGEVYFLSGAQPIHRFVSSASDSESIPLKHHLHSTSKLDRRDCRSDRDPVRPQIPQRLRRRTRFFFS
jgi:hypothetical protein